METDLTACREKFKKFERQDTKYREDLKHLNKKLKKLDEKIAKVRWHIFDNVIVTMRANLDPQSSVISFRHFTSLFPSSP